MANDRDCRRSTLEDGQRAFSLDAISLSHHEVEVANGVRLHYVEAGRGPLVVLLHG